MPGRANRQVTDPKSRSGEQLLTLRLYTLRVSALHKLPEARHRYYHEHKTKETDRQQL